MMKLLEKLVAKLESLRISLPHFLLIFAALIVIRILLEGFGYGSFVFPSYANLLVLSPVAYLDILLSILLVIVCLTKIKAAQMPGILLAGMVLAFVNPILHLFTSQKMISPVLVVTSADLPRKFFTFLIDSSPLDLTIAVKIQTALFIIFVIAYIFIKTKSFWKTILGGIIAYVIGFFYNSPLFIFAIFAISLKKGAWDAGLFEIMDFFNKPPGFLAIRYPDTEVYHIFLSAIIMLCLLIVQALVIYFLLSRRKAKALFKSARPSRLVIQFFIFFSGCVFAYTRLDNKDIWSFDFYAMILMATLAIITSWLFSVFLNDMADRKIDRISNPDRPLPQGIFKLADARNLAIITAVLTLAMALTLGFNLFFLYLVFLALGYLYSAPPLRFKKWPLISNLTLAGSGSVVFAAGYLLFNANNTLTNLPSNIMVLVFVGLLLLSSLKDLKDYAGDRADNVYTLFTILGMRRGKIVIAIATFVAIMFFPIILRSPDLLFLSAAIGVAELFLIFD